MRVGDTAILHERLTMLLRKHLFSLSILLLLTLAFSASFTRFYLQQDYLVKNEIECDPYEMNCYVWCEEDDLDCEEPYYYAYATREATALKAICGTDITECDEAWYCDPEEIACVVEYCDPDYGECETLSSAEIMLEESENSL